MRGEIEILELCDKIRQEAFNLHRFLQYGHLEKVYENGLYNRLLKEGIHVEKQKRISVKDEDGTELGDYFADLFVENEIIIELKVCKQIGNEHLAQAFGYLRATQMKHALIINFGAPKFEIRKIVLHQSID